MPTCPQGIVGVYAANRLGAVASTISPALVPGGSGVLLADEQEHARAHSRRPVPGGSGRPVRRPGSSVRSLARIPDYLPFPKNALFRLTKGRAIAPVPADARVHWWKELMRREHPSPPIPRTKPDDTAVILFSGGTTGTPKGIPQLPELRRRGDAGGGLGAHGGGDSMLAILPLFHGFGLGVCVNAFFMGGGKASWCPSSPRRWWRTSFATGGRAHRRGAHPLRGAHA